MSRPSKSDNAPAAERPRSSGIRGRQQENQLYFARAYNSPTRGDGGLHDVQEGQNGRDRTRGSPLIFRVPKPVDR